MNEFSERPPFWSYLRDGAVILLIACTLTLALHNTFIVKKLEVASLDGLFVLFGSHPAPDIMMVEITQDDFANKNLFAGKSPLNRELVTRLIQAIDGGGARAIGVDILSEDWPASTPEHLGVHAPVVWVCGAEQQGKNFQLDPVMGGTQLKLRYGPPAFQAMDGMVRQYFPYLKVVDRSDPVPSFSVQLARAAGVREANPAETDTPEFINFLARASSLNGLAAHDVLAASQSPAWAERKLFKDKIVLLGGAFKENRDLYATALGDMYGVEILANILQADLSHRPVHEANWITFIFADLLLGLGIISAAYWLPSPWILPATFFGAPLATMVVGLILFAGWGFFLSFMPVAAGVVIHAIVEHVREHLKLQREHESLRESHDALKRECEKLRAVAASSGAEPRA
jgi:CHASE2 domain-containing sensor protein